MAEEQGSGEKTEAPTAKRLEQARESGQTPLSREATSFASMTAVVAVLVLYTPKAIGAWLQNLAMLLAHAGTLRLDGGNLKHLVTLNLLQPIWAPLLAAVLAGTIAVLLQTNLLVRPAALSPNVSRINPMAGVKRIFGPKAAVEVLKSLVKMVVFVAAIYFMVRADLPVLRSLSGQDLRALPGYLSGPLFHVFYAALGVQAGIAAIDVLWVRFQHAQQTRMSKQDIRDEFKQSEGNPHVKARIRRIGISRTRRRMMARVKTATVVITNPTHYAVALVYERSAASAPRIVAKGADRVAAKIRELAEAESVPIVSNPPLARALFKLELDTEIPAEHFRAVAQIIAYVWRLRREPPKFR